MSSSDPPPLPPPQPNLNSPSVTIVLTVILLVFFFIGFFSIYFCRCFMESVINSWHFRRTPSGNVINPDGTSAGDGLDPSLIMLFPTFNYSSVKNYQREKYGLECAICLAEFEDEDALRLLTVCYHIFHQECIDLWLKSQKTCPVCRTDLDLPRETLEKARILLDHHNSVNHDDHSIDANQNKSICIDIRDDDHDDKDNDKKSNGEVVTSHDHMNTEKVVNREKIVAERSHSRSHSTGHSIATTREGDQDRYTLRLQENVKVRIKTGHNATESCITFGELSNILREESSGCSKDNILNIHV